MTWRDCRRCGACQSADGCESWQAEGSFEAGDGLVRVFGFAHLFSGFVWGFVFFLGVGGVRKWLDILRIALIERKSEHLLGYWVRFSISKVSRPTKPLQQSIS